VCEISVLRENIKGYLESERKYGFYCSLGGNMDILKTEIKYGHNFTRTEIHTLYNTRESMFKCRASSMSWPSLFQLY